MIRSLYPNRKPLNNLLENLAVDSLKDNDYQILTIPHCVEQASHV